MKKLYKRIPKTWLHKMWFWVRPQIFIFKSVYTTDYKYNPYSEKLVVAYYGCLSQKGKFLKIVSIQEFEANYEPVADTYVGKSNPKIVRNREHLDCLTDAYSYIKNAPNHSNDAVEMVKTSGADT